MKHPKIERTTKVHSSNCPSPWCRTLTVAGAFLLMSSGQSLFGVDVIKANNTDNLNLGSSWSLGNAPTAADVGVWNSTVTSANTTSLGGNLSWQGIRLDNPTGLVTINSGNTLTLGSAGINVTTSSSGLAIGADVVLGQSQTWTVASGRSLTATGVIDDSGSNYNLTFSSGGSVSLSGLNTYGGATNTGNSIISVSFLANGGQASSIGDSNSSASNLIITSGGELRYVGSSNVSTDRQFTISGGASNAQGSIVNNGAGVLSWTSTTGPSYIGSGTRNFRLSGTNTGDNSFAGVLSDNGASATGLTKADSGRWRLTAETSSYTGVTSIGGTLSISKLANGGSNSSIGASTSAASNLLISNGGVLEYTGTGDSTDRLFTLNSGASSSATITSSGSGAISFTNTGSLGHNTVDQAKTLNLRGTNTGINSFAPLIQNNGSGLVAVTKSDAGTWALTGSNTYDGVTTVNAGTLLINGDQSGATGSVTVTGGSTLGGTGTVGGATTLGTGAKLSPGSNSASTLTFSGNLTATNAINNTNAFVFTLGTASDLVVVGGTLTIGSGSLSFDDFAFTAGAGFNGGTYMLFDNAVLSGTLAGSGLTGTIGGYGATLGLSGTDIIVTVVPEPSTWLLLIGGLVVLVGFGRRAAGAGAFEPRPMAERRSRVAS